MLCGGVVRETKVLVHSGANTRDSDSHNRKFYKCSPSAAPPACGRPAPRCRLLAAACRAGRVAKVRAGGGKEAKHERLFAFSSPTPPTPLRPDPNNNKTQQLTPLVVGACCCLAALQARHLWQERER